MVPGLRGMAAHPSNSNLGISGFGVVDVTLAVRGQGHMAHGCHGLQPRLLFDLGVHDMVMLVGGS